MSYSAQFYKFCMRLITSLSLPQEQNQSIKSRFCVFLSANCCVINFFPIFFFIIKIMNVLCWYFGSSNPLAVFSHAQQSLLRHSSSSYVPSSTDYKFHTFISALLIRNSITPQKSSSMKLLGCQIILCFDW